MGHETLWFPNNIGKTATPGRSAPRPRAELERGRAPSAGFGRLGVAVAAGMDEQRRGGLGCQTGAWSAAQADGSTMPAIAAPCAEGRRGVWLSQRAMDLAAHATVRWLEFRVRSHPSHVWKVLRRWHWRCQVPERRTLQRDEPAIAHWKRYKWPAIKKSPKTWRPSRVPR
jgi:Winged helix-turn helix